MKSSTYKVLSCDAYDEYIKDNCSLKTAISKTLIEKFKKNRKIYSEENQRQQKDLLKFIFDEKDSKDFFESIIYIIDKINENKFNSDKEVTEQPQGNYMKITQREYFQ